MVTSEIVTATKAELLARLTRIEGKLDDLEDKMDDYRAESSNIEDELERRERCRVDDTGILKQLLGIVEEKGTWHEQEIVRAVIDGNGIDSDDRQRVNILGIQFLNQTVL